MTACKIRTRADDRLCGILKKKAVALDTCTRALLLGDTGSGCNRRCRKTESLVLYMLERMMPVVVFVKN